MHNTPRCTHVAGASGPVACSGVQMPPLKPRAGARVFSLDDYRAKCRERSPPKYLAPPQTKDPFLREAALMGRALHLMLAFPHVDTEDLRLLLGKMRTAIGLHLSHEDDPIVHALRLQADAIEERIQALSG